MPRCWQRGQWEHPELTITSMPIAAPEGPFSTSTETNSTSTVLLSSLWNLVATFLPGGSGVCRAQRGLGCDHRCSVKPLFVLSCLLPPARGRAPQQPPLRRSARSARAAAGAAFGWRGAGGPPFLARFLVIPRRKEPRDHELSLGRVGGGFRGRSDGRCFPVSAFDLHRLHSLPLPEFWRSNLRRK